MCREGACLEQRVWRSRGAEVRLCGVWLCFTHTTFFDRHLLVKPKKPKGKRISNANFRWWRKRGRNPHGFQLINFRLFLSPFVPPAVPLYGSVGKNDDFPSKPARSKASHDSLIFWGAPRLAKFSAAKGLSVGLIGIFWWFSLKTCLLKIILPIL